MGETASSVPNPCYVVASPHGRVQCGLPVLRVTVSPNRVSTHPDQERLTLFTLTAPRNNALKGSYRAVDQSVKLTQDRPTHAGLSNSEHSARQPKTWKAAALPTELLPPEVRQRGGPEHRSPAIGPAGGPRHAVREVYQAFLADLATPGPGPNDPLLLRHRLVREAGRDRPPQPEPARPTVDDHHGPPSVTGPRLKTKRRANRRSLHGCAVVPGGAPTRPREHRSIAADTKAAARPHVS